jgi:anti-sigma factor ChrR (cupin superfamily)
MDLNADFTKRVVMHADEIDWLSSPMPGVDRRMLDRIGDEVARATTIVRYAPNSKFSPHVHPGGEEFIVLEGVFQDEHGDFSAGSYIRNPPTSSHTPGSDEGCVIFVKIDMNKMGSIRAADRRGVSVMPLFQDDRETVQLETWDAGADVKIDLPEGGEYLVLEGDFTDGGDQLRTQSWLRIPKGGQLDAKAGQNGAKVWSKTRHLRFVDPPAAG